MILSTWSPFGAWAIVSKFDSHPLSRHLQGTWTDCVLQPCIHRPLFPISEKTDLIL